MEQSGGFGLVPERPDPRPRRTRLAPAGHAGTAPGVHGGHRRRWRRDVPGAGGSPQRMVCPGFEAHAYLRSGNSFISGNRARTFLQIWLASSAIPSAIGVAERLR